MSLSVSQSVTAVGSQGVASFLATGGTAPYVFSVIAGGAGGTIDPSTGSYNAPIMFSSSPNQAYDTIQVVDATSAMVTSQILVTSPLGLLGDIIQNGMGLSSDQIWFFDQKINIPTDSRLYVNLAVPSLKILSNSNAPQNVVDGGLNAYQSAACAAIVDVDILSRGPAARDMKEQIVLSVYSVYSQQQQTANAFGILRNRTSFINLSGIDGAAIPYRYRISFTMFYNYSITVPSQYYDTFEPVQIATNNP